MTRVPPCPPVTPTLIITYSHALHTCTIEHEGCNQSTIDIWSPVTSRDKTLDPIYSAGSVMQLAHCHSNSSLSGESQTGELSSVAWIARPKPRMRDVTVKCHRILAAATPCLKTGGSDAMAVANNEFDAQGKSGEPNFYLLM